MKIITVIGARPQFIKAATVSRFMDKDNEEIIIHTGQHYDWNMSEIFFEELGIPKPKYNLHVGSGGHGYQTGEMLKHLEEVYKEEKPDLILVYGDTNSTLAGALCASKMLIPVAHVEAGLRSYNKNMPEEQNRILTDHISKYLFAPTETAMLNLEHEGIIENVYNTGDVMYDAVLMFGERAKTYSNVLERNGINSGYILATIHRSENTDNIDRLGTIISALNTSGEDIVLPLHPRTLKILKKKNILLTPNVKVIPPVGYLDMIVLESNSRKIVTDSGGVQKEAYFLKKPCITMRDETEWIETVNAGCNLLTGADRDKICNAIIEFNGNKDYSQIFGDGMAGDKILRIISSHMRTVGGLV